MVYRDKLSDDMDNQLKSYIDLESMDINLTLLINGKKSIFYVKDFEEKNNTTNINLLYLNAKTIGIYFMNTELGIFNHEKIVYDTKFLVKDKLKKYQWILTDESKLIDNRKCYKAIFKDTIIKVKVNEKGEEKKIKKEKIVIAWYCPEISLSFGPLGYYGLPGLIMELHDDIFVYFADKISFKIAPDVISKIQPLEKGIVVTSKEFENEYKKLKNAKELEQMNSR